MLRAVYCQDKELCAMPLKSNKLYYRSRWQTHLQQYYLNPISSTGQTAQLAVAGLRRSDSKSGHFIWSPNSVHLSWNILIPQLSTFTANPSFTVQDLNWLGRVGRGWFAYLPADQRRDYYGFDGVQSILSLVKNNGSRWFNLGMNPNFKRMTMNSKISEAS